MSIERILEIIYTVTAALAFGIGSNLYFRKPTPLFVRMVVCMLGCRFLQGLLEMLLVREGADINSFSLTGIGEIAQFLFLICANYGAIDSLCDDGTKEFLKYRIIAGIIPLGVLVYGFFAMNRVADSMAETILFLVGMVIPLIALYYHIKHLIIKDVEDGIIGNIRLYNLIGIINCGSFFVSWASRVGSLPWIIAMILFIVVNLTILPALVHGAKKWTVI